MNERNCSRMVDKPLHPFVHVYRFLCVLARFDTGSTGVLNPMHTKSAHNFDKITKRRPNISIFGLAIKACAHLATPIPLA